MNGGLREIQERPSTLPGLWSNPEWVERWPWLIQGITTSEEGSGGDFALFGPSPAGEVLQRWEGLLSSLPGLGIVHARQVHGRAVRLHPGGRSGLTLTPPADAHMTRAPGLVLAVSVADCVPVSVVAPDRRAVALVHAGWRGAASGILEAVVQEFRSRLGIAPDQLHVHLGPSICGRCYEVGPEVHAALGEPEPGQPRPVDLRANLGRRAVTRGVDPERVTRSSLCTLCGDAPFYSHRGGHRERQIAILGTIA